MGDGAHLGHSCIFPWVFSVPPQFSWAQPFPCHHRAPEIEPLPVSDFPFGFLQDPSLRKPGIGLLIDLAAFHLLVLACRSGQRLLVAFF